MPERDSKVRVLIARSDGPGGVGNYFRSIEPHLSATATVIVGKREWEESWFERIVRFVSDYAGFLAALVRRRPELIHLNPSPGLKSLVREGLLFWTGKLFGCKILLFFRGGLSQLEPTNGTLMGLVFKPADHTLVLSDRFKSKLRRIGFKNSIDVEITTVDQQLVEGFDFDPTLRDRKKNDRDHILFLSRIIREKGIQEFIESLRLLRDRGREFIATVAGDGADRDWMKQEVERMGLGERIRFPGYLSGHQKREAYEKATLYCLPSYEEGMPNSVLEAMAFGLPVVTTPVGGLESLCERSDFGELIPVGESEPIARAIENCGVNSDRWEETSRRNYQFAQKNFLAPEVAGRLQSHYDEILST